MRHDDPAIRLWMQTAKTNDYCDFLTCEVCGERVKPRTRGRLVSQRAYRDVITCGRGTCISEMVVERNTPEFLYAECAFCKKPVVRKKIETSRNKSSRLFCNRSCAAKYNNCHKSHGTRRSKLEAWIESELVKLYPSLEFHFNQKDAINSELDIYIPSLRLAFELNGIYHYEPIHGAEKLATSQNNDSRKLQACIERGISFCTIDTSASKSFKPERDQKYLDLICQLIDQAK